MPSIGVLLPGQGAQAVGMGKTFYDRYEESREVYKRANARLGYDLTGLCFEGPLERLTQTEHCQLALLVTSVAAYAAFRRVAKDVTIVAAAGLSLGELTALTVAEAMTFPDALYLVQARAAAMSECAAKHPGAMLAVIGLTKDVIDEICRQAGVTAANFNAPDQLVLSGTAEGIQRADELAKAQGAKRAIRLEVSGAFHSPMMQPAADVLKAALQKVTFMPPKFPVLSNVTGQPIGSPEQIAPLLVRQLTSSVLWEPSMRWMAANGVQVCVEMPPARVLTGLLRRIDPAVKGVPVDEPADFDKLTGLTPVGS